MDVFNIEYIISGVLLCLFPGVIFSVFYFRRNVCIHTGSLAFTHSAIWAFTTPSTWVSLEVPKWTQATHSSVWETHMRTGELEFRVIVIEQWRVGWERGLTSFTLYTWESQSPAQRHLKSPKELKQMGLGSDAPVLAIHWILDSLSVSGGHNAQL